MSAIISLELKNWNVSDLGGHEPDGHLKGDNCFNGNCLILEDKGREIKSDEHALTKMWSTYLNMCSGQWYANSFFKL